MLQLLMADAPSGVAKDPSSLQTTLYPILLALLTGALSFLAAIGAQSYSRAKADRRDQFLAKTRFLAMLKSAEKNLSKTLETTEPEHVQLSAFQRLHAFAYGSDMGAVLKTLKPDLVTLIYDRIELMDEEYRCAESWQSESHRLERAIDELMSDDVYDEGDVDSLRESGQDADDQYTLAVLEAIDISKSLRAALGDGSESVDHRILNELRQQIGTITRQWPYYT